MCRNKAMSLNQFKNIIDSGKREAEAVFRSKRQSNVPSIDDNEKAFNIMNRKNILINKTFKNLNQKNISITKPLFTPIANYNNFEENLPEIEEINNNNIIPNKEITKNLELKQIPMLKISDRMQYDSIQLIEALNVIDLQPKNINKLIDLISSIRKRRQLKVYDFDAVTRAVNYVHINRTIVAPSYLVSFIYSLSRMQMDFELKDENLIVFDILATITSKLDKLDLRTISNLTFALQNLQLNSQNKANKIKNFNKDTNNVYNFDEFFDQLEIIIIEKIGKYKIDSQSVSNIIASYAKTQNGSIEFYRIFEKIIDKTKENLKPQELAVILYSYSNNSNCDTTIFDILELQIFEHLTTLRFNPNEICNILRAYDRKGLLTVKNVNIFLQNFIEKHEQMNSYNIAHFYSIIVDMKRFSEIFDTKLFNRFNSIMEKTAKNLYFNFTGSDLAVIFNQAKTMQKLNPELFKTLKNRTNKLIEKNDIKGYDLKIILENIKDLQYEGKYNVFRENIEQFLSKIKYF